METPANQPNNQQQQAYAMQDLFAKLGEQSQALGMQKEWAEFQTKLQEVSRKFEPKVQAYQQAAAEVEAKTRAVQRNIIIGGTIGAIAGAVAGYWITTKNKLWKTIAKVATYAGTVVGGTFAGGYGGSFFGGAKKEDIENLQQTQASLEAEYNKEFTAVLSNYVEQVKARAAQAQQGAPAAEKNEMELGNVPLILSLARHGDSPLTAEQIDAVNKDKAPKFAGEKAIDLGYLTVEELHNALLAQAAQKANAAQKDIAKIASENRTLAHSNFLTVHWGNNGVNQPSKYDDPSAAAASAAANIAQNLTMMANANPELLKGDTTIQDAVNAASALTHGILNKDAALTADLVKQYDAQMRAGLNKVAPAAVTDTGTPVKMDEYIAARFAEITKGTQNVVSPTANYTPEAPPPATPDTPAAAAPETAAPAAPEAPAATTPETPQAPTPEEPKSMTRFAPPPRPEGSSIAADIAAKKAAQQNNPSPPPM